MGDRPQGVAGDCNSLAETHAWFDSRVAHHYAIALKSDNLLGYPHLGATDLDTFCGNLDTMQAKKVKHLIDNNGSWTYRRRVPIKHQKTLGFKMWAKPCGNVSYLEAVVKVAEWTATHDAIIKLLDDPQMAETVRQETESHKMRPAISGVIKAQEMDMLPTEFDPLDAAVAGLKAADQNIEFNNQDRLIQYRAILEASFGSHVAVPSDPDKRDEYDLVKRKLERRVADIAGDPNTIGAIA